MPAAPPPSRPMLEGAFRALLADALFLPMGLLAASFLTRSLGPSGYGLFALASTPIAWIDWVIASAFSAAIVKAVGEAADWRPVGTAALRLHAAVGVGVGLVLWTAAPPIAGLLNEPVLATYLRLFAFGLPAYSLASAHRYVLVGRGDFRQRALATAGRAIAAPLLIILLVELGLSVPGAIAGNIGACLVEIVVARRYVRLSPFRPSHFPVQQLWGYAVPLFLFGVSLRLFSNLDLLALKILGGTAAQAGIYSAAQNLAIVPGYLVFSFSPLLLSALSRLLHGGEQGRARGMSTNTLRAVVAVLPFIATLAGAAPEIVTLFFGSRFVPAGPILAVLVFGVFGRSLIVISATVLTAAGKPRWTAALLLPTVPLAMLSHWWLIPRLGAIGAALVTATLSLLTALAALGTVYRLWAVRPPAATLLRSLALCIGSFTLAALWPAPGLLLLVKLAVIGVAVLLAALLLREFSTEELVAVQALLTPWKTPERQSGGA
jgi:O-antigen/teichoic acid export membrane protein